MHFEMPIATKHQRIVAFKYTGIHDASSAHDLNGQVEQGLSGDIGDDFDLNDTSALQDAETRHFGRSPLTPGVFSHTPEAAFIGLHLPTQQRLSILGLSQDAFADEMKGLQDCWIGKNHLAGSLECRDFQFEQLHQAQPLLGQNTQLSYPSVGPIGEFKSTTLASISLTTGGIDFTTPTTMTNTALFSTGILLCTDVLNLQSLSEVRSFGSVCHLSTLVAVLLQSHKSINSP